MKHEVVLPKNIRQIGEIQQDKKIYLEDYVMTYIRKKEEQEGCIGILLGKKEKDEQGIYLFIKGALLLNQDEDLEKCWEKMEEEQKNYFPDTQIWGYFLVGTIEEEKLKDISERFLDTPAIIFHLQEGEENIYWSAEKQYQRLKGYFIFYERNPQMQKYMAESEKPQRVEEEGVSDKAIVSFRKKVKEKAGGKRSGGMRYLASSFLVLTILILGATIVNNYDRMKNMEKLIAQISLEQQMQEQMAAQVLSMEVEAEEETEAETEKIVEAATEVTTEVTTEATTEANTELQEVIAQIEAQETIPSIAEQSLAERNYSAEDISQSDQEIFGKTDEILSSVQRQSQSVYTIRYGDTLADISEKYYGSLEKVEEICELNEIDDANMIVPGQKIVLP